MKNHWNSTIRRKAELGLFKDEADSISLDIQQFVEGEVQLLLSLTQTEKIHFFCFHRFPQLQQRLFFVVEGIYTHTQNSLDIDCLLIIIRMMQVICLINTIRSE